MQIFQGAFFFVAILVFVFFLGGISWCDTPQKVFVAPSLILKISEGGNNLDLDLGILLESMQIAASYHVDRRKPNKDEMVSGMVRGFLMCLNGKQRDTLLDVAKRDPYDNHKHKEELRLRVTSDDGLILELDAGYLLWTLRLAVKNGLIKKKKSALIAETITMGFVRSLDCHSDFMSPEETMAYVESFDLENTVLERSMRAQGKTIYIIKIIEFTRHTAEEFKKNVSKLIKEKDALVIFDLRDNPGGLDNTTEEILGYILGSQKVLLSEIDYTGAETIKRGPKDSGPGIGLSWKIACLVNRGTASNAEVFSACLRDQLGAKLIGTTTYGKGVGGTIIELESGKGACRITYARWYTPKGVCIEGKGLAPDISTEDVKSKKIDLPLNIAINELLK